MNATPRNLRLLSGSAKTVARRSYATYRSPYGPKYDVPLNVQGWTVKSFVNLGTTLAGFGGVAGFFALFFFSDIPRVRRDIMQRVPILGEYWIKEVHPADNVRSQFPSSFHLDLNHGRKEKDVHMLGLPARRRDISFVAWILPVQTILDGELATMGWEKHGHRQIEYLAALEPTVTK